jgi:cell fate regulator YaaT (PSP1 superfamily)
MPVVVGIRFKDSGKTYFFDPNHVETLSAGDHVIVETVRGLELAKVAIAPHEVGAAEIVGELKPVVRRAEAADFERIRLLSARHDEAMERCGEKVAEHNLPMRLVKAEYSFDGSRLTFYFTSEKRVDFRLLVRDLARTFKTRIELRQIGPRDEAKLLGGIGPCGRLLCCATFLPDYARVSIKMAKDQDLPLNPTKISGVCGRLLCCLSYEHEQYIAIKAELPKKGAWVQTPDGPGEVVTVNVVRETVIVELAGSGIQEEFSPAQISDAGQRVGNLARSRAEEGITPRPNGNGGPRAERPEPAPRREPKHSGERRLLRDEVIDPDVLDALALLEEGEERAQTPRPPAPAEPRAESPGPPASRPGDPRRTPGPPAARRMPQPPHHQQMQPGPRQQRPEQPQHSEVVAPQLPPPQSGEKPDDEHTRRHRRKRSSRRGEP